MKRQFQFKKINWIYREGISFTAVAGRLLVEGRIAKTRYTFAFELKKKGGG